MAASRGPAPSEPDDRSPSNVALEYARSLHEAANSAYAALYTRAQVVLSVNGIILGAVGAVVLTKPADLRAAIDAFGWTTWCWFVVAVVSLVASVLIAAAVITPRGPRYTEPLKGTPTNMWYYAKIARVERDEFVAVG